jgi:ribosomal protein L31
MSKEIYDKVIDIAYENFRVKVKDEYFPVYKTKEQFIDAVKNYPEFSKKWGLKIEESELSLEEMMLLELKLNRVPTKQITLTYNNEIVKYYES